MRKALLIMAAALMTLAQCRKQETVPATPSANTIKMTVTAGSGAKTDITDEGKITWTSGDVLYVSDGAKWLGSLTLVSGAGNVSGTFTGTIQEIGDGVKTCHFFYLGHDNGMAEPSGENAASISFASQDGSRNGALKYHLGHGSAEVTVSGGEATCAVAMRTEIAMAHLKLKMDDADYTGSVTMDVSNTMTVSPAGTFSGSGNGIAIGNNGGTSGDRYVTLIPTTGTESVDVSFSGSATGSLTFGHGIQANNLYGMANGIEVALTKVSVTGVTLEPTSLSLKVGETDTLTATVLPENATCKSVTWSSSDESVATVSGGVVTAVAAGEATITVTTVDGGKTAICTVTVTEPSYLPGEFTINIGGTKVKFSKGNLYWDSSAFRFEANQWSFAKTWDASHVSHFFWSNTTDWQASGKEPYASSYSYSTQTTSDEFFTNSSSFQVAGETPRTWRTLSSAEWIYLLDTRIVNGGKGEGKSYKRATVNGVYGLILYPDSYTAQSTLTSYSGDTWTSMEKDGVVFLPAAGYRSGTSVNLGSYSYYWSSTPNGSDKAYSIGFGSSNVNTGSGYSSRVSGFAVRLVR